MSKLKTFLAAWMLTISIPCFSDIIYIGSENKHSGCPIEASIDQSSKVLTVMFRENVQCVRITILSATGDIVYDEETSAYATQILSIPMVNAPTGNYILYVKDDFRNGEGDFTLE